MLFSLTQEKGSIEQQTPCSRHPKLAREKTPALFICLLLNALVKALQAQMGKYVVCTFTIKTKIAENYIHGWQGTENCKISKNNST